MLQTFKIEVASTGTALQVKASCRGFELTFDEPEEAGGANTGMNPVEGVLCTLGACQSIAAMIFAHAQGVQLDSVRMEIEGDVDPDGFMGVNPDVRNGLSDVRCRLIVSGPDKDAVRKIAEMAEQRCPVSDSIQNPVPVSCEIVVE